MAATLVVLIAAPAHAQLPPTPDGGQAPQMGTPMPDQSRQRYVPQHFTRDGQYVAPHYEAPKQPPFRGYFADRMAQREHARQHGYQEPTPDYTTPQDNGTQRIEGR